MDHRPKSGILVGSAHAKLIEVGLPQNDCASCLEATNHGRRIRRLVIRQHLGATGRALPLESEIIF